MNSPLSVSDDFIITAFFSKVNDALYFVSYDLLRKTCKRLLDKRAFLWHNSSSAVRYRPIIHERGFFMRKKRLTALAMAAAVLAGTSQVMPNVKPQ